MMGEDCGSGSDEDSDPYDDFPDDSDCDDDLPGAPPLLPMNMEQWQALLHQMCAHHPQNPFAPRHN